MFNIGAWEWIVLAVVVLVFVGPEQLPGVIRRTGQIIGQLRSMSERLRGDFMDGMAEIEAAANPKKWTAAQPSDTSDALKADPFAKAATPNWVSTAEGSPSEDTESEGAESVDTESVDTESDGEDDGPDDGPNDGVEAEADR